MARCAICNYCRETDGGNREVTYSRVDKEELCSDCRAEVWQNTYGNKNKTYDYNPGAGDVPLLELEEFDADELSVEGLDILEEFGVDDNP
jgi:hypothetical protein